jgi:hypothetical protein
MNFEATRKLRRTRFLAQRTARELQKEGFHCTDLNTAIQTIKGTELNTLRAEIRGSSTDEIINNAIYIARLTR